MAAISTTSSPRWPRANCGWGHRTSEGGFNIRLFLLINAHSEFPRLVHSLTTLVNLPCSECGARANEEGWLPDDALASIAFRVVHIMFSKLYGRGKPKGLFGQVQARYASGGNRQEFLNSVSDGALYTVLLAALAKPEALSLGTLVQQADALSHLKDCPDLLAVSYPDQRSTLAQNVIIRDAAFAINERAEALVHAVKKLTASVQEWDRFDPGRTSRSTMQRAGSVLWSAHGWQVTPRSPAETYCSGINLDTAATESTDMQDARDELWRAMRMGRTSKSAEGE